MVELKPLEASDKELFIKDNQEKPLITALWKNSVCAIIILKKTNRLSPEKQ